MSVLLASASAVAVIHTAMGIDHTLPFVVLARAQKWSVRKLLTITLICGSGHVISSILLGIGGIFLGLQIEQLMHIESRRGTFAAWLLMGFGLAYFIWALYRFIRGIPHTHIHVHSDGQIHSHPHQHHGEHLHPHPESNKRLVTTWSLFIIFVFGPCEPMIPFIMAAYERGGWVQAGLISILFSALTLLTMTVLVLLGYYGLKPAFTPALERYHHILASLVIIISGVVIKLFGI